MNIISRFLSRPAQPHSFAAPFSVEAVIFGRNDSYEPGWNEKLEAAITYNRSLFESSRVDYRVAFVEWNPPDSAPLLSPKLVEQCPFVRCIVVEPGIHEELCETKSWQVMLNFAFNAGIRSSQSDYLFITGADIFLSRALATKIVEGGLEQNILYRAERVNVRNDLDFKSLDPETMENPDNIMSVDSCMEPPFDKPPYTNACGDFILMDRASFMAIRGFDEGIRNARMHLDSRCCKTAMAAGMDCKLIGRIFHISHERSFTNMRDQYPDTTYEYEQGIPYTNPTDWGLYGRLWSKTAERLLRVSVEKNKAEKNDMIDYSDDWGDDYQRQYKNIRDQIYKLASEMTPPVPQSATEELPGAVHLEDILCKKGASVDRTVSLKIRTRAEQWGYSAVISLALPESGEDIFHYWVYLKARVEAGAVGVAVGLMDGTSDNEKFIIKSSNFVDIYIPINKPSAACLLIFRNAAHGNEPSVVEITDITIRRKRIGQG